MFRTYALILLALLNVRCSAQQEKRYAPSCVGFYNIENLYDTIDSPDTDDAEWLPNAPKHWNTERYRMKLAHLTRVIGEMAKDVHPDGLACLGLCEVENRAVLEDLVKEPAIAARKYRIVHHDGPDRRGVDVAFLYNPSHFTYLHHKAYPLVDPQDTSFRTREQLVVTGILDGDTVSCIVAHWPSRRSGEKRSQGKRFLAAGLGRHIADSLLALNANARIMYMGDLNDDPVDASVRRMFGTTEDKAQVSASKFFNPMVALHGRGIGSLAYQDVWNLFDQMLLSPALTQSNQGGHHYYGARVFNQPFLAEEAGRYKGYPLRTFTGDDFTNGYSDHFPVFVILVKDAAQP